MEQPRFEWPAAIAALPQPDNTGHEHSLATPPIPSRVGITPIAESGARLNA